jgi:hypothetical protein
MPEASRSGHCLCGEVRFVVHGEPKWVSYCHCESCRRQTAAPVAAYAGFRDDQVEWTAARPRVYNSSPGVARGFCGHCGSPVSFRGEKWPGETHLHLGLFDAPDLVPRKEHLPEEKLPWLHLVMHPG